MEWRKLIAVNIVYNNKLVLLELMQIKCPSFKQVRRKWTRDLVIFRGIPAEGEAWLNAQFHGCFLDYWKFICSRTGMADHTIG